MTIYAKGLTKTFGKLSKYYRVIHISPKKTQAELDSKSLACEFFNKWVKAKRRQKYPSGSDMGLMKVRG